MYKIEKIILNNNIMNELIELSRKWRDESISYGIVVNGKDDFVGKDIYVAYNRNNKIVGYLLCSFYTKEKQTAAIPLGSEVCYIDEIYVDKRYRNKKIGQMLYRRMEEDVKDKCSYIELVTSTKDYEKMFNFYEKILDMNFYSACFYKKLF